MADIALTQDEADSLMHCEKRKVEDTVYNLPDLGGKLAVPLEATDRREEFVLDVYRGRIALQTTWQNRAKQVVVLIRLDVGGPPHRNPDGEEIPCPHLHIYREGFGTKWARPVPADLFRSIDDASQTLDDFLRFCNVVDPPIFNRTFFT